MAPTTIPPSSFPSSSFPGAATITISSDDSGSSKRSIVDVSSSSDSEEATSKRKWSLKDECVILATMADLRRSKWGVVPRTREILEELGRSGFLRRRGTTTRELSKKVRELKYKFAMSAKKAAANGGKLRRLTNYRDKVLFEESMDVWPEMLEDGGYSYLQARPARRRRRK